MISVDVKQHVKKSSEFRSCLRVEFADGRPGLPALNPYGFCGLYSTETED